MIWQFRLPLAIPTVQEWLLSPVSLGKHQDLSSVILKNLTEKQCESLATSAQRLVSYGIYCVEFSNVELFVVRDKNASVDLSPC